MRKSAIERNTKETRISLRLALDGSGEGTVDTGIGFFNHMLELFKKHALKTMYKKADSAVANAADDKEAVIRLAIKKVDQAAAKGIMHKNAAARKKGQLAKKLNAAKA